MHVLGGTANAVVPLNCTGLMIESPQHHNPNVCSNGRLECGSVDGRWWFWWPEAFLVERETRIDWEETNLEQSTI